MKTKFIVVLILSVMFAVSGLGQSTPPDSDPVIVSAPDFRISTEDEAWGIDGTVKVAVEVGKSGKVEQASVYVGPGWPCSENLEKRVDAVMRDIENAVREYKFSPAISNGKPVSARIGLAIKIGKSARDEAKTITDPAAAAKPKLVSGGVVNGKTTSLAAPEYPAAARATRASGTVNVQVLIGEDGKVISAQAISGLPVLQFAARDAACRSKFSPTTLAGQPVKVSGVVVYNFVP